LRKFIKFILTTAFVVVIVCAVLYLTVFNLVKTGSNSMVPNIVEGDYVAVYKGGNLDRGDIAVCRHPDDPTRLVMLRVMGLPGDKILIMKNRVRANGRTVQHEVEGSFVYYDIAERGEPFEYELSLEREMFWGHRYWVGVRRESRRSQFPKVKVERGVFLLADNRNLGEDSRDFGEVMPEDCIGQAMIIVWPGKTNGDLVSSDRILDFLD